MCKPTVDSSSRYSAGVIRSRGPGLDLANSATNLIRGASPPDRVGQCWPKVRYELNAVDLFRPDVPIKILRPNNRVTNRHLNLSACLPGVLRGKHDSDLSGRSRRAIRADNDLHVPAKPGQAIKHFRFANTAKLTAQQLRQFGLRDTENIGGLLLAPLAPL